MTCRTLIFGLLVSVAPAATFAGTALQFPKGAVRGFQQLQKSAKIDIAVGPFVAGRVKTRTASGRLVRQVWRTPITGNETLGLLEPLRGQLQNDGFKVVYECATRECGGFDFRFNTAVLDEPEMHVDLGDFRYLCATKTVAGKTEFVSLLVSRSPERGFVQLTQVAASDRPESATDAKVEMSTKQAIPADGLPPDNAALSDLLNAKGATVLDGLVFQKGSASLSGSPAQSLQDLAAFLADHPKKSVLLVGHTDASGSLSGNIALSRKRAESVVKRLVNTYGVNPTQLTAEGVGYLAPRASNATAEGRDKNRRVEVVLSAAK